MEKFDTESPATATQIPEISDPDIANLRANIKDAVIPVLIKIYEAKHEGLEENLQSLYDDLEILSHWCESAKDQIQEALSKK